MSKQRAYDSANVEGRRVRLAAGALGAALALGCGAGGNELLDPAPAPTEEEVVAQTPDGSPSFVVGKLGKLGPLRERDDAGSSAQLQAALGPLLQRFRLKADDLVLRKVHLDPAGTRHLRLDQKHHGLDVVGGELIVHVDGKGTVVAVNGGARGELSDTLGQGGLSLSGAEAIVAADPRFTGLSLDSTRLVYIVTDDGVAHLAYESVARGFEGDLPRVDKVYTDVDSARIVAIYPQVHSARSRQIYSANNALQFSQLPGELKRSEGGAATGDADIDGLYDRAGDFYDAYQAFFGRDSYDDNGGVLAPIAHYKVKYCNAIWDGANIAFGDGDPASGCNSPARARDVVAHELTHAITRHESGLNSAGESGGINESISDIFGAFVEAWVDGGRTGTLTVSDDTWRLGEDMRSGGLRSLCDPARDGRSADVWDPQVGELSVHYSAGVGSLAFCLLSLGGVHPHAKTDVYVPAIGMANAIKILYTAQTDYLTSTAKYADLRTAMEQAAIALGYDSATTTAVSLAYAAVGVGTVPPDAGDLTLTNRRPMAGLAGTIGKDRYFKMFVPTGQSLLRLTTSGGTGNLNLHVRLGSRPTVGSGLCHSTGSGNGEACTLENPASGTYYVMVQGAGAYSGATLLASYNAAEPSLTNGVAVTGITGTRDSQKFYRIATPAGKTLTIKISGNAGGDADLYVRQGSRPTLTSYTCRPFTDTSNEVCTITDTQAGDYFVMVRAYTAYTGLSLKATF